MAKNLFVDSKIYCYNCGVIFPSGRFEKIVKPKQNFCLFFESCNSQLDLIKFFTQTMLRVYFNSLHDIFADFDDKYGLSVFYQKKSSSVDIFSSDIALELNNFFINNENNEIFRYMHESFVPLKDYDSICFNIVNKNYLKYIIAAKK